MTEDRTFPLQRGQGRIPWAWAEWFYRCYAAMQGRGQSLERLAERGGSSRGEIELYAREVIDPRVKYLRNVSDLPAGERPAFLDPELAASLEELWRRQEQR